MIRRATPTAALCAAALALTGCDDGTATGGFSSVGSTGVTATGRITGFGSLFVNGIEYDADGATITLDGQPASEQALALGMVVTVTGSRTGSNNGTATEVVYDAQLRGPVSSANNIDDERRRLTVAGVDLVIDADTTVFDGTGFATAGTGLMVEASGYTDENGRLQATYLADAGTFTAGNNAVEVSGTISNHIQSASSFTLNGLTVLYQPLSTALPVAGISDGDRVEVAGTIDPATPQRIIATAIEPEDTGLPAGGGRVELEGIVTEFNGLSSFRVGGRPVNAGATGVQFRPSALATGLGNATLVEVEGTVSAGELVAERVAAAGGEIEVEAFVGTVGATSFTLTLTPSTSLTVTADNRTQFDDETGAAATTFALAEIAAGNFLEVEAYQSDSGDIVASRIKRVGARPRMELQGPVTGFDATAGTVEVLGLGFDTNVITTDYFVDGAASDATAFFSTLASGAVVRVEEELSGTTIGDGTAEEIAIEG